MTEINEIDRQLDVAMNTQDHAAYAASARVHWPEALLKLREAMEMLDESNARILRCCKLIEAANTLHDTGHAFVQSMVKHGPDSPNSDVASAAFFIALGEYREAKERTIATYKPGDK